MRKIILKNAMVVAAMAIAAGSYGLMSFGLANDDGLHWYFKESNGSYTYLGQNVNPPTGETCEAPQTEEEICMKGLQNFQSAPTVDDATPAVTEILREPLSNP